MRQAADTDFAPEPIIPRGTQLASVNNRPGTGPRAWTPASAPPDLPDLPLTNGAENSLLLLPPLEFEGTELKKSSMRPPASEPPTLQPGESLPDPLPLPDPAVLELEAPKTPDAPAAPSAPATPPAPPAADEPAPPSPAPEPPVEPLTEEPLAPPSEPKVPA